jgi:AcrR family transcriptional regulator
VGPVEVRRPGRPRSVEADEAILDAALQLFSEVGYSGLSVESVAERAGVGKATIYRRYATKADLMMAATERLADDDPGVDTGTLRGDLEVIVNGLSRKLTDGPIGRLAPHMVSAMACHPDLAAAHRAFLAARRRRAREAFRRGVERGEVAPDAELELACDLVAGPIFYRHLLSGAPLNRRFATRLVDAVCRAVAP